MLITDFRLRSILAVATFHSLLLQIYLQPSAVIGLWVVSNNRPNLLHRWHWQTLVVPNRGRCCRLERPDWPTRDRSELRSGRKDGHFPTSHPIGLSEIGARCFAPPRGYCSTRAAVAIQIPGFGKAAGFPGTMSTLAT